MTPGNQIGLGLRAGGNNSASPDSSPFGAGAGPPPQHWTMDVGSAVDGLLLVLGTLFYLLTRLLSYVLYLLHVLASPLLYLGHGVLTIVLLPLQLLLKFEVLIHYHLCFTCLDNLGSSFDHRPFFIS